MYCNNCGKKLDDDAKFCPECGSKIQSAQRVSEEPEKGGASKVLIIVAIVLL